FGYTETDEMQGDGPGNGLEKNIMPHPRSPAITGRFYPDESEVLRSVVERYLRATCPLPFHPTLTIIPHPGYPLPAPWPLGRWVGQVASVSVSPTAWEIEALAQPFAAK